MTASPVRGRRPRSPVPTARPSGAPRPSSRVISTRRSRPRSSSGTRPRTTTGSAAASRRSPASARVCSMGSTRARRWSETETVAPGTEAAVTAPRTSPSASDDGDAPVLAALDIGTNSFHLVVARAVGADRFETLTREKEVVRLGHGGGDMKELSPDAVERGIACLRRMRGIVDSYGATLRAVATSAVREAANAGVFQAVPVFERRLLLVDIGGGSTELLIGEKGETFAARSFKLGAVRLTDRFFPGGDVTSKQVSACREYIRGILSHFQRDVDEHGFDVAAASSGTAEAVARVAHAMTG